MPTFDIILSDTVTYERFLPVQIEAADAEDAKQFALDHADTLMSRFADASEEEQVDNTTWEADAPGERDLQPWQKAVPLETVRAALGGTPWDGDTDSEGLPCNFENTYECDTEGCETTWDDRWSCACDDDCPKCGTTISPTRSVITDLMTGEVTTTTW